MRRLLSGCAFLMILMPPALGLELRVPVTHAADQLPPLRADPLFFSLRELMILFACLAVLCLTDVRTRLTRRRQERARSGRTPASH